MSINVIGKEYILPMFQNINCKKQVMLMIPSEEGQRYLALKKVYSLLRGVTIFELSSFLQNKKQT